MNNANNGADLRTLVMSKLKPLCPDNAGAGTCDSNTTAIIDAVENIPSSGADIVQGKLSFAFDEGSYNSNNERDLMLAAGIASWQAAANKSCTQNMLYAYQSTETTTCKGGTPTRRGLEERFAVEPVGADPLDCTSTMTVCSAPDNIGMYLPFLAG